MQGGRVVTSEQQIREALEAARPHTFGTTVYYKIPAALAALDRLERKLRNQDEEIAEAGRVNARLQNRLVAERDEARQRADALEATSEQAAQIRRRDEALRATEGREADLRKKLARAVFLAEHLHAMVPREVWRDSGGDDGQGHYEGDYHAEQTTAELKELAALAAVPADPPLENFTGGAQYIDESKPNNEAANRGGNRMDTWSDVG